MKKTQPKRFLIAFDMDGTLLNDKKTISWRTRRFLHHLDRQGHIVVLASGRPVRALRRYYDLLNLRSPLVCYNGACIINPHDDKFPGKSYQFPKETVKAIYEAVGPEHIDNVMCETNKDIWLIHEDEDLTAFFWHEKMNIYYGDLRETLTENPMTMIIKSKERGGNGDKRLLEAVAQHPGFSLRFWNRSVFSEIYYDDVSKGHALAHIAAYYGIPHEHIIAFGDAENDLEMLDMAGIGVAMKNATDVTKAHANVITQKDNNHNGIVPTLRKLLKTK